MSPELKRFIEECVGECVEKRLSQIIATSPVKKARLYDAWIGLLSFVTLLSAYFTMILILPTVPGILLLASCIITLVLFTFTRLQGPVKKTKDLKENSQRTRTSRRSTLGYFWYLPRNLTAFHGSKSLGDYRNILCDSNIRYSFLVLHVIISQLFLVINHSNLIKRFNIRGVVYLELSPISF